ncbi:late competence protein ComER [Paenibacillus crassostreae]|uniref:Pyrroline-5-carboxylate reductase n=1 Tax=Paenibacillus crassostreae TaxID=1763538 RepID=A0A167C1E3_9BACL|nr:late competence protein ComER [Paenibacillus crassostreae]AOZ91762.1 late competence protein ComER [Paenibacillus crassostreae]OAB72665.1 competence protein [Paenibacillus crassostreae]
MKVGIIGTGSMGSVLLEAFIEFRALQPHQLFISNRTLKKLLVLSERHEGLNICRNNIQTVRCSDVIFVCVKPLQFASLIQEIKNDVRPNQLIVSITSPVQISHLENSLDCKIAKIIPSVTHKIGSGASLVMYGNRLDEKDKQILHDLLSYISKPMEIKESQARINSDFSSCGPAFISFFLTKWIDAAVEMTGSSREEITCLASEMLLGTGKLLTQGGVTPPQLQEMVAVPGGITAQALSQLNHSLDGVFHRLISTTHQKYDEDLEELDKLFDGPKINRPQY